MILMLGTLWFSLLISLGKRRFLKAPSWKRFLAGAWIFCSSSCFMKFMYFSGNRWNVNRRLEEFIIHQGAGGISLIYFQQFPIKRWSWLSVIPRTAGGQLFRTSGRLDIRSSTSNSVVNIQRKIHRRFRTCIHGQITLVTLKLPRWPWGLQMVWRTSSHLSKW